VSFAAITLCVASQRVLIVIVYFDINSVRKLLDTSSYVGLFDHFVTCSSYIASNDRIITNELETMWKEAIVIYFKIQSLHLEPG
jgi:hypothetical protein